MYYSVAEGGLGIDRGRRRPASSARTAARSTSPRSSAPGSPTGCSARSACCSTARSSSWPDTSRSPSCPSFWGLGVGLVLVASAPAGSRPTRPRSSARSTRRRHAPRRRASRSSTSASTSARSSARSSPGFLQSTYGFHWGFAARRGRHGDRPDPVLVRTQEPARRVAGRRQPAPPQPLRRRDRASALAGIAVIVVLVLLGRHPRRQPRRRRHRRRRSQRRSPTSPSSSRRGTSRRRPFARVRLHPAVHRERRVLVAVPAAVHGAHDLLRQALDRMHLRLGDAGLVGATRSTRSSSSSCRASSRRSGRSSAPASRRRP